MIGKPQKTSVQAEARIRGLGVSFGGDLADHTSKAILVARVHFGRSGTSAWPRVHAGPSNVAREVALSQEVPTQVEPYERLLGELPRMAEAANKFMSEENQRAALDALLRAYGMPVPPRASEEPNLFAVPPLPEEASAASAPEGSGQESAAARQTRARKAGSKKSWSIDKEINFRPADKQSLREFADQKKPGSIEQKNVVIAYYMTEILGMNAVNVGQVLAGFAACQWKPSNAPDVSLRVTASKYAWLDTSDSKAIKLTHAGRSFVEFDLPKKTTKPA
jgi:hypothetical protein